MNWESASVSAGTFDRPPGDGDVEWREVSLPARGSDDDDHWFRTTFASTTATTLRFGGLATVCDVFVDGARVVTTESMFVRHDVPVTAGEHELVVCSRALTPLLGIPRKPRARWRSRVPVDGNLRWFRTSLLGRAPGFAPAPPLVGPWRPVELVDADAPQIEVRTVLDGSDGLVAVRCAAEMGELDVTVAGVTERLAAGGGTIRVPSPDLWWPHTHGEPHLHDLHVRAETGETRRRIGFRALTYATDLGRDGLDLRVNGREVFVRGAVWTPTPRGEERATLERACDGGLNMVRVVGTMVYEDSVFHDACDELGILVWQDLMFANLDYPFDEPAFRALVDEEVRQALAGVSGRPSLAVVCGNSEIEQQVAMLGLPPDLGRGEFFADALPALVHAAGIDAAYVPSAPTGGVRPFRTDAGVANYFGVGAYLRPLDDVRRASVRFASECLAFANVPEEAPPDRRVGVMRDVGADWDFADVRDHYLRDLHGVTAEDSDYWEHARHVTGELMAAVFGEWRRKSSPCTGGIVLWLRDLAPGSGWGLLSSDGRPKLAWHHLRRAVAPVAVWFVNEGLNGLALHMANDTPAPIEATLRLSLYRNEEFLVDEVETRVQLEPCSVREEDVESLFGRFVDIGYTYRFGEPQHDTAVATLIHGGRDVSKAFFKPPGLEGRGRGTADELGLQVETERNGAALDVRLLATRVVHGVRIEAGGAEADDDGFDLEPGRWSTVRMAPFDRGSLRLTALNLAGSHEVQVHDRPLPSR
jgi:beta-mannosidase